MLFTQAQEIQELSDEQIYTGNQPSSPSSSIRQKQQSINLYHNTKSNNLLNNYSKVIGSFVKINISMSMDQRQLYKEDNIISEIQLQKNATNKIQREQQQQTHASETTNNHLTLKSSKKSCIFTPTKTIQTDSQRNSVYKMKANQVDIYYFGESIHKIIKFSDKDNIHTLIIKALNQYRKQITFEQSLLPTTNPQLYQIRFSQNQQSCLPDMKVNSIQRDRKISDSMFDVLVLVPKSMDERKLTQSRKTQKHNCRQIQYARNGLVKLYIHNQQDIEIASIILSDQDSLQKVYDYIHGQLCEQISLVENLKDQYRLPNDYEIKDLNSSTIYVKKKKYMDEPENQLVRAYRLISHIPRDLSPNVLPPIGIDQASRYQQYQVIKINRRGAEQPRILGIDQTKIYNYEETVRKQKRQSSTFLSFINKQNPFTGTKQPQRLVSSVIKVHSLAGLNLIIFFREKNIQYIARTAQQKQKILRKLRFLINFHYQLQLARKTTG